MNEPVLVTALLPGDTVRPPEHGPDRSERIRQWHTWAVLARAEAAAAGVVSAAAEAAFDAALDEQRPMSILRELDRQMDTAAREHRAAIAHADRLAHVLVNATRVTAPGSTAQPVVPDVLPFVAADVVLTTRDT